ncbi:shikimate kinase [Paenilisteria rocourtiae]|uniref:Shikimate kinase n=1 Tax=Listeria rocourtiae TaxID=647910 RepID=A0A4R6ZNI2_9LIST|nr:shikimate kinase [Listeria rocourtiae]EUJ51174.1 shikimate kinase [Listeria rocourtiae FSL F6-920]MBC1434177.1 shikimate kinase [Listeria rocourtiae]MBC1603702.1 shikimate kinase [Listeria rocourtiae]TDR54061.1 shikimate kinase [Listeria rocourtiae]
MNQIVLTGFMGAGKSTVGKILAQELVLPLIDIDTEIEVKHQTSITEIFANLGESVFRNIEHQMLVSALSRDAIISTGGGIILSKDNRIQLGTANFVVYLKTSPSTFLNRLKGDTTRPLIQEKSKEEITALFESRTELYEEVADLILETDNLTPVEVAKIIKQDFQKRRE